jgi:hypothetical protein
MRGTIAFERLNCSSRGKTSVNVRIRLNDAVYRKFARCICRVSYPCSEANVHSRPVLPLWARKKLPD